MKRRLGKTGVEVNALGLGAMPLSLDNRPSEENAIAVIHAALDQGTDFIDTADVYCIDDEDIGHNERLICKALQRWQGNHAIYVATKGGLTRPGGAWLSDASPEHLRVACEKSLEALQTKSLFLYQLHAPDPAVPIEESLKELAKLQKEGKIQHLGLSNVSLEQLKKAQEIVRIETVQNRLNPFYQKDLHNGLIAECRHQGVTYIAYSPVGGWGDHMSAVKHPCLQQLSKKYAVSPYQVMLSWLLSKGDRILPIPGGSKITSVVDSVRAIDLALDEEDLFAIDQLGRKP